MFLVNREDETLSKLDTVSFSSEKLKERYDLQD